MLGLPGTGTLETNRNKQDLPAAISRCLAISVREISASDITSTCETCLCVNPSDPSWNCLFQEQVGYKTLARAYPEFWKYQECFLFVSISSINIFCCQQDWYKTPNPGSVYLKALQPWTQAWSFYSAEIASLPKFWTVPKKQIQLCSKKNISTILEHRDIVLAEGPPENANFATSISETCPRKLQKCLMTLDFELELLF